MGATFSIYLSDSTPDEVFEWIDAQTNLSASLRDLILASTEDRGITDLSAGTSRRSKAKQALESKRLKQARTEAGGEVAPVATERAATIASESEPDQKSAHIAHSDDQKTAGGDTESSDTAFGDLNSLMGF